MAGRDVSVLVTARCPLAYSFWASMMTRTESLVDAVEGGAPTSWRKDLAADMVLLMGMRCNGNSRRQLVVAF